MPRCNCRHAFVAALLLIVMLCQGTQTLAGTTGSVQGTVSDASTGSPIAAASVTATSPSQTATTSTDASGHYAFLSLAPDTYDIAVSKTGYDTSTRPGVTVFADQGQTVSVAIRATLKTIASVRSAAAGALLKPGTTADVYSVNAATAARASALGGGGALNSAYSAVASVPGVYVPTGSTGWNQTVLIRGGDYPQIGYEYDGVPVNRSFDNYPAHTASALGQQEVEVYTGSSPANAESTGLAGFINQVIKTGTFPGFGQADLGIATPAFYHKAAAEAGGASPNRLFSYYVGIGGYNQSPRYIDNNNGAGYPSEFGAVFWELPCPVAGDAAFSACYQNAPAGGFNFFNTPDLGPVGPGVDYIQAPANLLNSAMLTNRDNVVNLHFGIPHHNDAGRDDVQILYSNSMLNTTLYDSAGDYAFSPAARAALAAATGATFGPQGQFPALPSPSNFIYNGAMNQPLPAGPVAHLTGYTFPENPTGGYIPLNQRGGFWNDDSILKLQYQKNFGSTAYLRLYGYTFYSDWLNNDPNTVSPANPIGIGLNQEYELITHTRGFSGAFAMQLSSKNLLNLQASTTKSTVVRFNNSGSYFPSNPALAAAVSSAHPNNGVCYDVSGAAGIPADCFGIAAPATALITEPLTPSTVLPDVSKLSCGGAPCEWLAVDTGLHGTLNNVTPTFNAYSITDQYRPIDKLLLNLGLRYETYQFEGVNTNYGARPFWFAAYNNAFCASTSPGTHTIPAGFYGAATAGCPVGTAVLNSSPSLALTNAPANYMFHELEPRVGGTFTMNPYNVLRLSYGRYSQPANTAAEQYNEIQQDLPGFLGAIFYPYGYRQPGHDIPPEISNNYDISWEHQIKGTDLSWKVTPFWRATQGEQPAFFIDPQQVFVSNVPVGNLNARGVELAVQKGDFTRNGFAGQLALTYTYSDIKYTALPNGGTPLSGINNDIATFNAFTSGCAATQAGTAKNPACLSQNGSLPTSPNTGTQIIASPCYTTSGAPTACGTAGAIANPYWNAPTATLFNLSGPYLPTDTVVATTGLGSNSYAVPYVATLLLNYKHDRFAITPSVQFEGGQRYGVPENTEGIDPAAGCGALGPLSSTDPRYIGGTSGLTGGSAYNAPTCNGALIAIPDAYNHNQFDRIGQFVAPNQLLGNLLVSYDVSPKVSLQLTMANIFVDCFGGSSEPWTHLGTSRSCSYTGTAGFAEQNPVGNFYNPGTKVNPAFQYPYQPFFGVFNPDGLTPNQPFTAYFDVKIKM